MEKSWEFLPEPLVDDNMDNEVYRTLGVCLLLATTALALSLLFTHAAIPILKFLKMIDKPGERRIHQRECPRGGGIAIMAAFLVTIGGYVFLKIKMPACETDYQSLKLLLPLAILIPLGIIDDKFQLPAKVKFIVQIIAACFAWYLILQINPRGPWRIKPPLNAFLTIFWITAMINAFNMIDGIDGLAVGIGGIASAALALISWFTGNHFNTLILFVFIGALGGFLYYNWHPAKLFMGDTGSMCIGYILGIAGVNATSKIATISAIVILILICAVPVLDISFAVWRRIVNSLENVPTHNVSFFRRVLIHLAALTKPDRQHLHHRILDHNNKNQRKTVSTIYLLAIAMACVGVGVFFIPPRLWWVASIIALTVIIACITQYGNIELWHSTELVYKNYLRPRFGLYLNIFNPAWDVIVCAAAFIIARNSTDYIETASFLIPVFLVIIISRTYSVLWNYPSTEEYFSLLLTIVAAFVISGTINAIFEFYRFPLREFTAALGIASAAIIGERMFFHALRMMLIHLHVRGSYSDSTPVITTLLCGICAEGRTYVNSAMVDIDRAGRENIIGFIDRDHRFSHSYCYGLRVLGTPHDLEHIQEKQPIGKIVICSNNLLPDERKALFDFCQKHNVRLTQFRCTEIALSPTTTNTQNNP